MPANAAPIAKASSFVRARLTPIAPAAISSSRIAIQARPTREIRSRRLTKISSADHREAEIVVGPRTYAEADSQRGSARRRR